MMRRRIVRLVCFLIAGGVAACQAGDADGSADRGDGPVWAPGEEWRLSDEPAVVIGTMEGPEAIGSVGKLTDPYSGLALLGDGRIAFADAQAEEVRVYDASGNRLATFGRAGDGPGEFRGVRGVRRFRGDSILTWDSRAGFFVGTLTVFTPDGTYARTIPAAERDIGAILGVAADGTLMVEPRISAPPDWQRPETGAYREPRIYQRMSPDGALLATLGPFQGAHRFTNGSATQLVHFGHDTQAAMGQRYFYTGDEGRFEISVHDPESGVVLRTARRPYDPHPVTGEELSGRRGSMRRVNARSDSMLRARANPEMYERMRAARIDPDEVPASETHPVFNRIVEDADENLWVQHVRPAADSLQTWSVFDAEGSWLGEVELLRRLSVRAIGSDAIVVVERDDLGVQYVHVYRLVK